MACLCHAGPQGRKGPIMLFLSCMSLVLVWTGRPTPGEKEALLLSCGQTQERVSNSSGPLSEQALYAREGGANEFQTQLSIGWEPSDTAVSLGLV